MPTPLVDAIALTTSPVAVLLADDRPDAALQIKPERWGCVASMIQAATKGKTVVFDRSSYGCPGGGTGLGFGNCYAHFPIDRLLSTGGTAELPNGRTHDMGEGERFFESPEVAARWAGSLPFRDVPTEFIVCKPLEQVADGEDVALVLMLVNPDQLSALVTLAGFRRGVVDTVVSPWGAACQSILFALAEAERERPRGVLGFFDISQRSKVGRDILSFTMPYSLYLEMEASVEESFLGTEAWTRIRGR